jgi:hypothetical protein
MREKPLFLFFFVEACREIIDFDILALVLISGAKDLAGEFFFKRLLAAFGFEPLGTVAGGLGIRTKILPGGTIARFYGCGIGKIGVAAHRRASRPWTGRRAEAACRPGTGFPRSRFVYGERPSFEWLIIELPDGFLCLFWVAELDERESTFLSRFPIQRNRNIGQITNRRKVLANLILCCVVREISDEETDCHRYLVESLVLVVIKTAGGEVSQR